MASQSFNRMDTARRRQFITSSSSSTSGRSGISFWLPLVLTVGVATAGVAAWIWNERQDDETFTSSEDYTDEESRTEARTADTVTVDNSRPIRMEVEESVTTSSQTRMESRNVEDQTVYSRFSGAIARTPSPQQIFDGASKKVVAGFAAAGAAVGGVLTSIREEEKDEFVDHSRWSEEYAHRAGADPSTIPGAAIGTAAVVKELGAEVGSQVVGGATAPLPPRQEIRPQAPIKRRDPNKKRKSVAIVVSAETSGAIDAEPMSAGSFGEHITLLDHLPSEIDHDEIQLFVLIYAPDLKQLPAIPDPTNSSYSVPSSQPRGRDNERPLDAHSTSNPSVSPSNGFDTPRTTPGFSPPGTSASGGQSAAFSALYARAVGLVERPSMVLPFSTPAGWIYQLRHVEPSLLYLQQSFAGENGGQVSQVVSWVGQTVVVLGGEEGDGGLADDDDDDDDAQGEAGGAGKDRWWIGSDLIGLGKGVDIVDVTRLGEDWHRRAEAK